MVVDIWLAGSKLGNNKDPMIGMCEREEYFEIWKFNQ